MKARICSVSMIRDAKKFLNNVKKKFLMKNKLCFLENAFLKFFLISRVLTACYDSIY